MNYSPYLAKTGPSPVDLSIRKAEGVYFYDESGKKYVDLISGIGVSYVGHNQAHVRAKIQEQLDKHLHLMVYGEFDYPVQAKYAEKICELLGTGFEQVFFTNSGTEANEGAVKLAKRATGRSKIVSCFGAYHGSTQGSLSLAGNESRKRSFRPLLPDIHFMRFNNTDDLSLIDARTAAVIIEPIQGDAGVRIPDLDFMKQLKMKCMETGALLIFDEIQTGFGRTGKWFAFQHYAVAPDIITLGKSLGGGLPLGAFACKKSLMELLTIHPTLGHITTFGGNPVSCAAGLGSVEVAEKNNLIAKVEEKGAFLESLLINHPAIVEIRRKGLLFAVELVDEGTVTKVVSGTIENGVLIYWFLSTKNCFRIAPPLTISMEELEKSAHVILKQLNAL